MLGASNSSRGLKQLNEPARRSPGAQANARERYAETITLGDAISPPIKKVQVNLQGLRGPTTMKTLKMCKKAKSRQDSSSSCTRNH